MGFGALCSILVNLIFSMETQNGDGNYKKFDGALEGFAPVSSTRIDWKPRKRSGTTTS